MIKQTINEATAANPMFCESWEDGYSGAYTTTLPYKPPVSKIPCTTTSDTIEHPSHYIDGGIETIDYIRAKLTKEEFKGYCKGNIMKYISRAGKKENEKEDLQKAETYLKWLEEMV